MDLEMAFKIIFFKKQKRSGHVVSAPLIPENDPSVLFTTARNATISKYLNHIYLGSI